MGERDEFKKLLIAQKEIHEELVKVNIRVLKRIKYLSIITAFILFLGIIFWSHAISRQILQSKNELSKTIKNNKNDIIVLKKEIEKGKTIQLKSVQDIKDLNTRISLQRFYINMNTQITNKNAAKSIKDSIEIGSLKKQLKDKH